MSSLTQHIKAHEGNIEVRNERQELCDHELDGILRKETACSMTLIILKTVKSKHRPHLKTLRPP
jgi:hypothetical protein